MMHICAGLVGPKSENIEKVTVFNAFLKGSRGARRRQENGKTSEPEHFLVTLGSLFGYFSIRLFVCLLHFNDC